MTRRTLERSLKEGREGVKWELGLALLWTGKMGFTHWDWDLATGNGINNNKLGMGFLFFSGLLLRNFIFLFQNIGAKTVKKRNPIPIL